MPGKSWLLATIVGPLIFLGAAFDAVAQPGSDKPFGIDKRVLLDRLSSYRFARSAAALSCSTGISKANTQPAPLPDL